MARRRVCDNGGMEQAATDNSVRLEIREPHSAERLILETRVAMGLRAAPLRFILASLVLKPR